MILCIDNEVIFYTPYLNWTRTPVSFVIETHAGDAAFKVLKKDLAYTLEHAE